MDATRPHCTMSRLILAIAGLVLVLSPVNQIFAATLNSGTIDGSIGGAGASAGAAASLSVGSSSTTSGTSTSSGGATAATAAAATTTTQSAPQTVSPQTPPPVEDSGRGRQVIVIVPEQRAQAIPAAAVSSASSSAQTDNNQLLGAAPVQPMYSDSVGAGSSGVASGGSEVRGGPTTPAKLKRLEEFRRSPYYLPPFEDGLVSIPEAQLQFQQSIFPREIELYKQIAKEGVERRGKFGSSVALVLKYGGKLLGNFIRNRKEDKLLPGAQEPRPEFFYMLADLLQRGIDLSSLIKKERAYSRSNIDPTAFYLRVENFFNYFGKLLARSPFGLYLRWGQMKVYLDEPTNPRYGASIIDEGADLFAVSVVRRSLSFRDNRWTNPIN